MSGHITPWPSKARTIYGNDRNLNPIPCVFLGTMTYLLDHTSTIPVPIASLFIVPTLSPGFYFSGDGAVRDDKGYYHITGRMDDVINVTGHRLGTAEVEDAMVRSFH